MNSLVTQQDRFAPIDGLRGIAAWLVLWAHHAEYFTHLIPEAARQPSWWVSFPEFWSLGRVGVMVFFFISGFVICRSPRAGGRYFWINRFFRLYPLFWVTIALTVIFFHQPEPLVSLVFKIMANATMVPNLFSEPMLMGTFWTLQVEIFFYGIIFVWVSRGGLKKPGDYLLGIGLLTAWFVLQVHFPLPSTVSPHLANLFRTLPDNIAIMFWGGLYRIYFDRSRLGGPAANEVMKFLWAGVLILCIPRVVPMLRYWNDPVHLMPPSIATAFVVALTLFLFTLRFRRFGNRSMVWAGRVSYGIYLLHPFAFSIVTWLLLRRWIPGSENWDSWPPYVALILSTVVTLILSKAASVLIEQPSIRLGRKLSAQFRRTRET